MGYPPPQQPYQGPPQQYGPPPGQQPYQQAPPGQYGPPPQYGPPAQQQGPPPGYGQQGPPPPPGAQGGYYGQQEAAQPNWDRMYETSEPGAGGSYTEGRYPAVASEATWQLTSKGDKNQWVIKWQLTGGPNQGASITAYRSVSEYTNAGEPNLTGASILYGELAVLGIPVGEKYGSGPGTVGFWRMGWTPHDVARAMVGKAAEIEIRNDEYGAKVKRIRTLRGAPGAGAAAPPQQAAPGAPPMTPQGSPAPAGYPQPGPPPQQGPPQQYGPPQGAPQPVYGPPPQQAPPPYPVQGYQAPPPAPAAAGAPGMAQYATGPADQQVPPPQQQGPPQQWNGAQPQGQPQGQQPGGPPPVPWQQ